jgi:hypothetical protein
MLGIVIALEIWASLSVRSPKVVPNPFDWEVRAGMRGPGYSVMALQERENGGRYWGFDAEISPQIPGWQVGFKTIRRTAKKIDSQEFVLRKAWGPLGIGWTWSWIGWKQRRFLGSAGLKKTLGLCSLKAEYATNFRDRSTSSVEVHIKKGLGRGVFVALRGLYRAVNGKEDYGAKLEWGYATK